MKHFLIIGNSAAGIACAEAIRDNDKISKITIISDEDYTAYCRCVLSYYLAGEAQESKLIYRAKDFYTENKIDLILGKKVVAIGAQTNQVILDDNTKIGYDNLFIGAGAAAKLPDIKGSKKTGIFALRTISDANHMLALLDRARQGICLGGGLIGLKAAVALKRRGLAIKVVVKSKQILSQVLDKTSADILERHLESNGIEILTGVDIVEFIGDKNLTAVKLDNNKAMDSGLVVIGKGVLPNIGIAQNTQIKTGDGILTNRSLRTSVENIFAGGDCAQTYDYVYETSKVNALWPNATEQGNIAGQNMTGKDIIYDGSIGINSVDFFSLAVISMGIVRDTQGMEIITRLDEKRKLYKKILLKDNRIKGVLLLGNIENSGVYLDLIKRQIDVSSVKGELLRDSFNYAKIMFLLDKKERIYV